MVPEVIADLADMLVINKPAGLIAHSDGRTEEPSLAEWIAEKYPALVGVGGAWVSPQGESIQLNGIVHRLDRTTSGVMLVAKTDAAFTRLKTAFKERSIEKRYRALVYGHVTEDSGVIVAEIERTKDTPRRWAARPTTSDDPRAAMTEWRVLKRFESEGEPVTYLELTPKTGRTHQIRVHLASTGHPIVSDHLYASDRKPLLNFSRPALHAYSISLVVGADMVTFVAPVPADFGEDLL
jgi:23S rRNA pseudouridine1911/1915/1917 synthase